MAKNKNQAAAASSMDFYRLERKAWRSADPHKGLPAIYGGTDRRSGNAVIVKRWTRRAGVDDRELAEVWRDEIRQLYRLSSVPGARERLAMLVEPIENSGSYDLVLAGEQRVPLARLIDGEIGHQWFRAPRTPRNRLRLWLEMRRLAEALQILHGQGLIHRNLDLWSVLTSAGSEPDFLLTGFEWSMRLTSSALAKPPRARRSTGGSVSFYDDWRALGVLGAQILAFPSRNKRGERYVPDVSEETVFLLPAERDFLTLLLTADPTKRLDGSIVIKAIDNVLTVLSGHLQGQQPRLAIAILVGSNSRLSEKIREACGKQISLGEAIPQLQFMEDSLQDEPRLVRLKPRQPGGPPGYRLIGRSLTYELEPFILSRTQEESWWVARCRAASSDRPAFALIEAEMSLDEWEIELTTIPEADRQFGSYHGRTVRWDQLFETAAVDEFDAEHLNATYHSLMLVQIVEALVLATNIWPVRKVGSATQGSQYTVQLATRDDPQLTALSKALGMEPPAIRLQAALGAGQLSSDEWKLSDEPGLGLREDEHSSWRLRDVKAGEGPGQVLVFEGTSPAPVGEDLYLRLGGPGHDTLLKRRLKSLKTLKDHVELLAMLADHGAHMRPSHDPWEPGDLADRLDISKARAFEELWKILPLYLIQGPPGVGKTKLVQELVARRMRGEQTERLLLTAQSHSAVDHLLEKVREALEASPDIDMEQLLPLRCRPKDRDAGSGEWDLQVQAAEISSRFADSELVKEAPAVLQNAAAGLALACSISGNNDDEGGRPTRLDRAFEALLLRSANLVFASTNAKQLEQLMDEQARFDWSIVEEAGKATGVELLAPLLLSHRRLMIGDHKQLPPFNSEAMTSLLESSGTIKDALQKGRSLINRHFGQLGMDDVLDRFSAPDFELDRIAPRARDMLIMFETLIVDELGDDGATSKRGMGRRLEHQHRMHPAIAKVVSNAFYKGDVKTDEVAERRLLNEPSPIISADPMRLPDCPVLFVSTPFSRDVVGMATPERPPRWTNPYEAELCCDALALLRANEGERPSVAMLSPYRFQVTAMEDAIHRRHRRGELDHLRDFSLRSDGVCGTVDSFQGNEADSVIISLVRNNHYTGTKGLGFLSSPKRMNVLISRAKWRLILVGSWDFLERRFAEDEVVDDSHELSFLRRMLDTIRDLTKEKDERERPLARIISAQQLRGYK